jgi:hypothetical protein
LASTTFIGRLTGFGLNFGVGRVAMAFMVLFVLVVLPRSDKLRDRI